MYPAIPKFSLVEASSCQPGTSVPGTAKHDSPLERISMQTDVINKLAGITSDSPLAQLRASREVAFNAAQGSFDELFEPADPKGVSRQERDATALRIAVLEKSGPVIQLHRSRLQALGLTDADLAAIEQFPNGGTLSPRLTAMLTHTDLLTIEPRNATKADLEKLQAVGLTTTEIITISELIAFSSFQIRLLAALRALSEDA